MKFRKTIIALLLFTLTVGFKKMPQHSYSSDLEILTTTLEQLHPDLYAVIGKNGFDSLVLSTRKQLAVVHSNREALYLIQNFLFHLGDSHISTLNPFVHPYGEKILPFKIAIVQNELYIRNFPGEPSSNGSHIISINGTPGRQLIDSLSIFYSNDGARKLIPKGLPALFNSLYASFCQEPDTFFINTDRGLIKIASVHRGEKYFDQLIAYDWIDSVMAKPVFENLPKYGYCRFNDFEKKSGGLQPEKEFDKFMNEMITAHQSAIVIDLRYNSGGKPCMAARMASWFTDTCITPFQHVWLTDSHRPEYHSYLHHDLLFDLRRTGTKQEDTLLAKTKFERGVTHSFSSKKHYSGKVYVLVSDITASAATMFCSYLQDNGNVIFVGSETGGSINYFWGHKHCDLHLPYSGIDLTFATELLELKKGSASNEKPKPLIPDVLISYSITDYINGVDKEMDWINTESMKPNWPN
ncbi:MAG TPA: S41 family peptidase [Bacteroidia bacterium]|nr:S41 family peptidase [Bacteroidia bacterium]